ncbi:unnamed protein product [Linum tenue]|uniref:glucan endo-1,3-beta-D-glucosidase n=1 Tax=Linum tenue TaxID=586396 RepID=A0AAV0R3D5_9ROSI|nr:unnamed protein product [Linum tenue]
MKVVQLLKSQGLARVKVFDANQTVLRSLAGSGIKVTVDLPNEMLSTAAKKPSFVVAWVQKNVGAYHPTTEIEAITFGNEVFVDTYNTTKFLIQAMRYIHQELVKSNLHSAIKVSSPIALSALQNSYPSSARSFCQELVEPVFRPMLEFLRGTGSYLMVNAYPFFAYEANSDVISLDYALFKENSGVVDSGNGLRYFSLFDDQIDAAFAAMSALKFNDIEMVVLETGWPSKGDRTEIGASVANAATYNDNLIRRILTRGGGTPLRPKVDLTVYLFAMFNEDDKNGPTLERNYGLFYPNEEKVYDIPFTVEGMKTYKDKRAPATGGGHVTAPPISGGGLSKSTTRSTWCMASGVDCRQIQPGAACFKPNTVEAHASFAFNSYYQKNERAGGSCYFDGAAYVVTQPPSAYSRLFHPLSRC